MGERTLSLYVNGGTQRLCCVFMYVILYDSRMCVCVCVCVCVWSNPYHRVSPKTRGGSALTLPKAVGTKGGGE